MIKGFTLQNGPKQHKYGPYSVPPACLLSVFDFVVKKPVEGNCVQQDRHDVIRAVLPY